MQQLQLKEGMDEKNSRKKREIIAVGVFKLFSISCFYFELLHLGVIKSFFFRFCKN